MSQEEWEEASLWGTGDVSCGRVGQVTEGTWSGWPSLASGSGRDVMSYPRWSFRAISQTD
jgi:hypothetical protein